MKYYATPRLMFLARACISKKKADKEYAKYKQCMIKNWQKDAQEHYRKAKNLYSMSDLELKKADKCIFTSWESLKFFGI